MNTKTENNNSANNSVFLNNLFALCSGRKVEVKDALNGAGINSGYIERWQNGEAVTYEMLGLLSIYFHIPVDYFFELSVNEEMLDDSVKLTPKKPFKFAYDLLCALCDNSGIDDVYKEILDESCITLPPCFDAPKLKNKIISGQLNNSDYLSLFYLLSEIEEGVIPDDAHNEYKREMETLYEKKCKDTVNWSNLLKAFHFSHNQFERILRYAIKAADIKKLWRDYIRFNEHHIDEIHFKNVISYIVNCCPALDCFIHFMFNYCQPADGENIDNMINEYFGDEATAVGVCRKHNISIS